MNIRTSTKKPTKSADAFIDGATEQHTQEKNLTPTIERGVKMKNLAIPLDISKRLDAYVKEQNATSYSKISANSVIIEAIDNFLKAQKI